MTRMETQSVILSLCWNQEAEQSVGRGTRFPRENGKRVRERQGGGDEDPVWGGRHQHQWEQQEPGIQETGAGAGELSPSPLRSSSSTPASFQLTASLTPLSALCLFLQYDDDDERNSLTQGDKLRALKSKRQSRSSSGSLS